MAITKSAKKAHRQSLTKKLYNDRRLKVLKTSVKTVKDFIGEKNQAKAIEMLKTAYQALDKAAKRGIIKKGNANRKKSRLAKAIAAVK
jgi:small subunit ribosomal protein S20